MKELFWLASVCLLIWVGSLFISKDNRTSDSAQAVSDVASQVVGKVKSEVEKLATSQQAGSGYAASPVPAQQSLSVSNSTLGQQLMVPQEKNDPPIVEETLKADNLDHSSSKVETADAFQSEGDLKPSLVEEKQWELLGEKAGERAMSALGKINLSLGR